MASSAESETCQLRRFVASLSGENAALRQQQEVLQDQVTTLREAVSSHIDSGRFISAEQPDTPPASAAVSASTQTYSSDLRR